MFNWLFGDTEKNEYVNLDVDLYDDYNLSLITVSHHPQASINIRFYNEDGTPEFKTFSNNKDLLEFLEPLKASNSIYRLITEVTYNWLPDPTEEGKQLKQVIKQPSFNHYLTRPDGYKKPLVSDYPHTEAMTEEQLQIYIKHQRYLRGA